MTDLVKRNAEIVALVKARKLPMRAIAARYRLSTSSISLIAIRHGIHAQAAECSQPPVSIVEFLHHIRFPKFGPSQGIPIDKTFA